MTCHNGSLSLTVRDPAPAALTAALSAWVYPGTSTGKLLYGGNGGHVTCADEQGEAVDVFRQITAAPSLGAIPRPETRTWNPQP